MKTIGWKKFEILIGSVMKYVLVICSFFLFTSFSEKEKKIENVVEPSNVGFVNCKEKNKNNVVWSKVFSDKTTEDLFVRECLDQGRDPKVVYVYSKK
ncbi:hypothetical protein [Aureivirga marina]|uniref:hypothetical protein n=1 Tax=Aureivirga marina TaxID=1182451 RepID=UPI0018CBD332|nr:hypothetical protein [Aureivirga marina]